MRQGMFSAIISQTSWPLRVRTSHRRCGEFQSVDRPTRLLIAVSSRILLCAFGLRVPFNISPDWGECFVVPGERWRTGFRKGHIGSGAKMGVDHRVEQNLQIDLRTRPLARHQCNGGSYIGQPCKAPVRGKSALRVCLAALSRSDQMAVSGHSRRAAIV